ncbi:hypothetical protein [Spirosoma harenae]
MADGLALPAVFIAFIFNYPKSQ